MCGFVAWWDRARRADTAELEKVALRMTRTLEHRGPDDQGVSVQPLEGLALGHRRLSILDLTETGRQPMRSASGRYLIAYNGEAYNFKALRKTLEAEESPPKWRGQSDTEVLLAGFERWGPLETVKRIRGMFALAVYDAEEDCVWLIRDRLGQKPLYWTLDPAGLRAASELRALRAHPSHRDQIDRQVLAAYLKTGVVPQPRSILTGVAQVAPGTAVRFARQGDPTTLTWWDPAAEATTPPGDFKAAVDQLEATLTEAVALRTASDVPLGALLSGGVDSSLVVALLAQCSPQKVRTFTVGVDHDGYDESPHAREIAAHLGTDHTELMMQTDQLLDAVPEMAGVYDEPFADASQLPTWLVSRLTRDHVTVALSGDGGDELFGGYTRYGRTLRAWQKLDRVPRGVRTLTGRALSAAHAVDRRVGGRRPWSPRQLERRAAQLGITDLTELYHTIVDGTLAPHGLVQGASPEGSAPLPDAPHPVLRMMRHDLATYLPNDILVKTDRASMSVGLELRSPLLDHHVVEAALGMPPEWTWDEGSGKRALKSVLERHVPRPLWDRPKQGFAVPLATWLRGPLRSWGDDLLEARSLDACGLWCTERVRRLWHEHLSGVSDHAMVLWAILQFESWRQSQQIQTA